MTNPLIEAIAKERARLAERTLNPADDEMHVPGRLPSDRPRRYVKFLIPEVTVRRACDVCGHPTRMALVSVETGGNYWDLCGKHARELNDILWERFRDPVGLEQDEPNPGATP